MGKEPEMTPPPETSLVREAKSALDHGYATAKAELARGYEV